MIEINMTCRVSAHLKGWPVHEAESIEEASHEILGSPYWDIPKDNYIILDKNDTYSLLAVYQDDHVSHINRYLVVNMTLEDKISPVTKSDEMET